MNSGKRSKFSSWSLDSEGCLGSFVRMDEESSEEDLGFFIALDIAFPAEARANEGPSNGPRCPR